MNVRFTSLHDVHEFVSLATVQPYQIQVRDGERCVDCTSFMEMFTLDLSQPLSVLVEEEHQPSFATVAEKFLV